MTYIDYSLISSLFQNAIFIICEYTCFCLNDGSLPQYTLPRHFLFFLQYGSSHGETYQLLPLSVSSVADICTVSMPPANVIYVTEAPEKGLSPSHDHGGFQMETLGLKMQI